MPDQVQPPDEAFGLPQHLLDLLPSLPAKIDRSAGAALVTQYVFPTTSATVKGWQLPWEYPQGRAIAPPASYLAYALRKAGAAPQPRGRYARRQTPAEAA
jgi:hypothetical protein